MARPSPVPLLDSPSRCGTAQLRSFSNGSNSDFFKMSGTPGPVSATKKRRCDLPFTFSMTSTPISIVPSSVNFVALESRLSTTCETRPASPITAFGRSFGKDVTNRTPSARGRFLAISTVDSSICFKSNGASSSL